MFFIQHEAGCAQFNLQGLAKELLTYQEPTHESDIIAEEQLNECMRDIQWQAIWHVLSDRLPCGYCSGLAAVYHIIRPTYAFGDVVVSMPYGTHGGVVEYDFGKQTPNGFQRKGFLCPIPKDWLYMLTLMKSDHRVQTNRITEFVSRMLERFPALSQYRRPSGESDVLFKSSYHHDPVYKGCGQCDKSKFIRRRKRDQPNQPFVHYGLIASGHLVVKDGTKRDIIGRADENIMCIEMEAAGVINDFPCVVIRGISDYADSHKTDDWQAYAAAAAAGAYYCHCILVEPHKRLLPVHDASVHSIAELRVRVD